MIWKIVYLPALLGLNYLLWTQEWGSAYLSAIILLTFLVFMPRQLLHPNNMLFGFYALYVVVSSFLNLILEWIGWDYVLPGGQQVFWNEISKYTLLQVEFTFLVLYLGFYLFTRDRVAKPVESPKIHVNTTTVWMLIGVNIVLVLWFLESTAGIAAWINDYSVTYLSEREGHGLLNIITITVGNALAFILGMWTHTARNKLLPIVLAVIALGLQAYMNGFKGRLIFLMLLYFAPWLMMIELRLKTLVAIAVAFFSLLYLTTLVRTEGYYASAPFFLEMLINYFNAYQLHDWVVMSRNPALLETVGQIFTKPAQVFGLAGPDADFDISVMLTKEFFPDQWYLESATQQWPLETEAYLNYYGFYLSWVPLLLYAYIVSRLFHAAVTLRNTWILPLFVLEFNRIFTVMRGTLVPWEVFFMIAQYPAVYIMTRLCLSRAERSLQFPKGSEKDQPRA
ncbi:hypothetical protein IP84_08645 [beta proteobacterium AAP99]|nr:hypothetical protein IP84_08645 [beta proteobacterium AAP99]